MSVDLLRPRGLRVPGAHLLEPGVRDGNPGGALAHAVPADLLCIELPAEDRDLRHLVLGRKRGHLSVSVGLGPVCVTAGSSHCAGGSGARGRTEGGDGSGPTPWSWCRGSRWIRVLCHHGLTQEHLVAGWG
eukprot:13247824-Alexandrium_andersonii.AAC.1